jgi:hypothetical protein
MSVAIESPDSEAFVTWSQWLLDSYQRRTGRGLLDRHGDARAQARSLFNAPFVVVSHDHRDDPVLNYGNALALRLWALDWDAFIRLPSRATAEAPRQAERLRVLEQVTAQGYIDGYSGIRIDAHGNRFRIEDVTIWEVDDDEGVRRGQAATFRHWTAV